MAVAVMTAAATQFLASFVADISVAQNLFMQAAQPVLMHGNVDQAGCGRAGRFTKHFVLVKSSL